MRLPHLRLLALAVVLTPAWAAPGPVDSPRPVPFITAAEGRASAEADVVKWIATAAHPMASPDVTPVQLAPLVASLRDARIVGIGEITHGTHEDLAFKSSLIRAMVAAGVTDRVVFELNRRTGDRLDRFVAPGSAERDAATAMREAKVYQVWMTHELADLLTWLQHYNATAARAVHIVGVDVQDTPADLRDALEALDPIDPPKAAALRAALSDWLTPQALGQHQSVTLRDVDVTRWARAHDAAAALREALIDRDAAAASAAGAAFDGLDMLEYDVPGKSASIFDVPPAVISRRDVAMAERTVASVPPGHHAVFWAHNGHVVRGDSPVGMGYVTTGAYLHQLLGPDAYRVVSFSARDIVFNAKNVTDTRQADRTHPFIVWRYTSGADGLGTLFSRTGHPMFWVDLSKLPQTLSSITFRALPYDQPGFGWSASDPFPAIPTAFGYQADVVVFFDTMTPSHRL